MSKQMIAVFTQSSTELWAKITKEVSWAYRLHRSHAPTIGFVMGRGTGLLPTHGAWEMLRKEVNKQRRNARARAANLIATKERKRHREYMRTYMAKQRRLRAKKARK